MTNIDADHVSEANAHLITHAADIARRITDDQARAAAHAFGYTVLRRESDNKEWRQPMTNIGRAAEIIERATRGAHTTGGHPMKMSYHTARIIAEALADEGMLMPDDTWARVQECDAR